MRNNIEAAGVHLADCTLLCCRHELETELKREPSPRLSQLYASLNGASLQSSALSSKQQASPNIRVDGELIALHLAMSSVLQAEAERKERLQMEWKHKREREKLCILHDEVRHTIVDSWSLGVERLGVLEQKERISAYLRERNRKDAEWREDVALQHLADEARLWADVEQVMSRERDEGRLAYHQGSMMTRK